MENLFKGISIAGVFMILLAILTWPVLSLHLGMGESSIFRINQQDRAKISVTAFNSGRFIPDLSLNPDICISAKTLGDFSCMHEGPQGVIPCSTPVCKATDEMTFNFSKPYPNSINFIIEARTSIGFLPIGQFSETYLCGLNEDKTSYNC
ncbi:MAG: hypothetical protein V1703_04285 [Candidatus Altiarchaeota archaeon]